MKKFHAKKSFKEIRDDFLEQKSNFDPREKQPFFNIVELDGYKNFSQSLDPDCYDKIVDTLRRARVERNSDLFKKLTQDIWEFRISFKGLNYRLLAFWHTVDKPPTVLITHGFIKKTNKIPHKELRRAIEIRSNFLGNTSR